KRVQPAVVTIITYSTDNLKLKQGTGFFVTNDGEIITNIHVLENAARAEAKTADGEMYPVIRVVAADPQADLVRVAVLAAPRRLNVTALTTATEKPIVGERVLVIGSPLGLEQTVSEGIISAIRNTKDDGTVLQISAPISPGSSGSPVVNLKGEVIGV